VDVRPFSPSDLAWAAGLLAERGNAHPLAAPLDARAELAALLDEGATGVAADGGFLLAAIEGDGTAWVRYAGHAARDVATYRHLYATAARSWVEAGARRHAVEMPEGDPVAGEAFANLAFGREHVYALASLDSQPAGEPDPRVRLGGLDDYDSLKPMFGMLARHLAEPACWSPRPESYFETLPEEFREDMAKPEVAYVVARVDGVDVGFATFEPLPPRVAVPDDAWALGHMVVRPEHRGRGLGRAMTLAGLALGRERGHTVSWTDWRLTNMTAEPYWRTYGWTPFVVRMTRRIEPGA
jgi:GNAT superfamily N-acetyltransferase